MILQSPFPLEFTADLWHWLNTPRGPNFEDGGAETLEAFSAELAARVANEKTFCLIDSKTGKPIGFIGFAACSQFAGWFRGMAIHPEHRGKGFGAAFLQLAVRALTAQGFRKMSAFFFADNAAVCGAFARAGAFPEGFMARAAMRGGRMVDVRLYSFTEGN